MKGIMSHFKGQSGAGASGPGTRCFRHPAGKLRSRNCPGTGSWQRPGTLTGRLPIAMVNRNQRRPARVECFQHLAGKDVATTLPDGNWGQAAPTTLVLYGIMQFRGSRAPRPQWPAPSRATPCGSDNIHRLVTTKPHPQPARAQVGTPGAGVIPKLQLHGASLTLPTGGEIGGGVRMRPFTGPSEFVGRSVQP